MKLNIPLPSIADQQRVIYEAATEAAIQQLRANLDAPRLPGPSAFDASLYPNSHLLREHEGWEAPSPAVVEAFFRHFQDTFPDYGTDKKLARLLSLRGDSADRRIREYKAGSYKVPYGVWRHFLVLTGRVPQDIVPILAFMR